MTYGLDHRCSTNKVRREQVVGIYDVIFTSMNMYKSKIPLHALRSNSF